MMPSLFIYLFVDNLEKIFPFNETNPHAPDIEKIYPQLIFLFM